MKRRQAAIAGVVAVLVIAATRALFGSPGTTVTLTVPPGSTLYDVSDTLSSRGIIRFPTLFEAYARLVRADRKLKAGTYELAVGSSWRSALRSVTRGQVVTVPLTIPEGYTLALMAPRIAEISGGDSASVLRAIHTAAEELDGAVPGPGLEGYLFPDTYRFARGVPVESVVSAMAERYREIWTPERRTRLDELDMTEVEVVTLASIIQAEARHVSEMRRISGVYHNRLDQGWLLQADPTVLYALGGYRARLLFAAIDSVEDSPYNTYTQRGLPPGPIGAPGELAIDAALDPEPHDLMYFVAMPDGSHLFTRTLAEHNAAREQASRAREADRDGI